MKGAPTAAIIDVVNKCPTNALTFSWNDLNKNNAETSPKVERDMDLLKSEFLTPTPDPVKVSIMRNGPLLVVGSFKIIGPDGNEMKKMKMASFCRCGESRSLPFCDGTHFKVGFNG